MTVASDNSGALSLFQRRIWFLQKMEPSSPLFNLGVGYRIRGDLDCERLKLAMKRLVERYDIIRAYFPATGGQPEMRFDTCRDLEPLIVDLASYPGDERESRLKQLIRREYSHNFDLEHAPLFRCMGVNMGDGESVIFFTIHHLLTDGQVLSERIAEDAMSVYLKHGDWDKTPADIVPFRDYVSWEQQQWQGGKLEKQLSFWREQFEAFPDAVGELPTRHARPPVQVYAGTRFTRRIEGEAYGELCDAIKAQGSSRYAFFLAAWLTILHRASGSSQVVCGCPFTLGLGRRFKTTVGPMLQILPIFEALEDDETFQSLLRKLSARIRKSMANSTIPFEAILRDQEVDRDLARQPIFQTYVTYVRITRESIEHQVEGLQRIQADSGTSLYDLSLEIVDKDDAADLTVIYSTELYDEVDVEWFVDTLMTIFDVFCKQPEINLLTLVDSVPETWTMPLPQEKEVEPPDSQALEGTERKLAEIWSQILDLDSVSRDDNFFQIGGHSLLIAAMIVEVHEEFNVELQFQSVFELPKLCQLAAQIDALSPLEIKSIPARPDPTALFPLSHLQEQIWFLHKLDPEHTVFNVVSVASFPFAVDPEVFTSAANKVVARHELLRTGYKEVDNVPMGRVNESVELNIPFDDIRLLPLHDQQEKLKTAVALLDSVAFDIESPPLLRLRLFRVRDNETIGILAIHHLIADNWSIQLFVKELMGAYKAELNGLEQRTVKPEVSYADYGIWQRGLVTQERLTSSATFWKHYLAGAPELIQLPWDRPRPPVQSYRGGQVARFVSRADCRRLATMANEDGGSIFVPALSAFALMLHHFSREADIVVGNPITNRGEAGTQSMLGDFVNTLPIRLRADEDLSVAAFLKATEATVRKVLQHRHVPFEKIVEQLNPKRDASYTPIYQVMFDLHTASDTISLKPSSHYELFDFESGHVQCDLVMTFTERKAEDSLVILEYNSDLFDAVTARQLLDGYISLLKTMPTHKAAPLGSVSLIDENDQPGLSKVSGVTREITDKMLCELVWGQGKMTPDKTAIVDGERTVSYQELLSQADCLSKALLSANSEALPVGISLPRGCDAIVAMLAVQRTGVPYVILPNEMPAERLKFMVEDAGVKVVVTDELCEGLAGLDLMVIKPDELPKNPSGNVDVKQGELACIIYTSGSTGNPRGVCCTHRGFVNRLEWMWNEYPYEDNERCCQKTAITFVDSVAEIFSPLAKGVPLYIAGDDISTAPESLATFLSSKSITRLVAVPSLLQPLVNVVEKGGVSLENIRIIVSSGEPLPPQLATRILSSFPNCRLLNIYGSTEVSADVTCYQVSEESLSRNKVPVGFPIDNVSVKIVNSNGGCLPLGFSGEIMVSGACLADGYTTQDAEEPLKFTADPHGNRYFKTGDVGRLLPDGNLEILGRSDAQMKIRGIRISPEEIENALVRHNEIMECAVVSTETDNGDAILAAFYVPAQEKAPITAGNLRQFLREKIPDYMVPNTYHPIDRLPLNSSGKLDRKMLLDIKPEPVQDESTESQPRNELEIFLTTLWKRCLMLSDVGIHDNFFELGGHSLAAAEIILSMEKSIGKVVPLTLFFEAPTIARQVEILKSTDQVPTWKSLVPIQAGGSRPPLFCFHGGFSTMTYWDLSRRLGPDQPVYGLERPSWNAEVKPDKSLEEIVAEYIVDIRKLQPFGPYYLAGSSAAGIVAYEAARQLMKSGEEIALVAMFDTYAPGHPVITAPLVYNISYAWHRMMHHIGSLRMLENHRRMGYLIEKFRLAVREFRVRLYNILRAIGVPAPATVPPWAVAFWKAMASYKPESYEGKVVLFRASEFPAGEERDPTRGWGQLIKTLDVREIQGFHGAIISEPRCEFLVKQMTELQPGREKTDTASDVDGDKQP